MTRLPTKSELCYRLMPSACLFLRDMLLHGNETNKSLIARLVLLQAPSSNVQQDQPRHIFQLGILLGKKFHQPTNTANKPHSYRAPKISRDTRLKLSGALRFEE